MIKKALLTIIAILIAGGALMMYGTYKVIDQTLTEKEPLLRQYVQLDAAAQNKFISDNVSELLAGVDIDKDGKPEDKEQWELFMKANDNPEIQAAFVQVGRSLMAATILLSEPIVKDMSADIKTQYQKESDEFDVRLDKYTKLLEASGVKVNKD